MPEGFGDALDEVLRLSHELRIIDASSGINPLDSLSHAFNFDLRSARSLAEDPRAFGKAVLVRNLSAAGVDQWDTTLRAFHSGCAKRTGYASLIVAVVAPQEIPVFEACGAVVHPWKGAVTRTDATLVALTAVDRPRDPLMDRLAVEIAVALCGWDLSSVAVEAARRAHQWPSLFTIPTILSGTQQQVRWEDGLCDLFDGTTFVKVECCDVHEARRRIWQAQVAVLFGWLEQLRLAFIPHVVPNLRHLGVDLWSCEWAELSYHLRDNASRDLANLAEKCRRLRNQLAHGKSLRWNDFARVITQARRVIPRMRRDGSARGH